MTSPVRNQRPTLRHAPISLPAQKPKKAPSPAAAAREERFELVKVDAQIAQSAVAKDAAKDALIYGALDKACPVQTTPVQTTPVQTTPVQTTPVQTTPVQTTPVQTTPVQTTPVQTTPVQTPSPPPVALKVDRMTHLLADPASRPMVDELRARYKVMDDSITTYAPQWRSVAGTFYSMFILPFNLPTDTALKDDVSAFQMGRLGLSNGDNNRPAVTQDALRNLTTEWPKSIATLRAKLDAMPQSDATRRGYDVLNDLQRVVDQSARPLLSQMQAAGIGSIVTDVVTAVMGRR